nr:MAG TPA: hypothetical protein [Caudoviricetes sp.]
MTDFVHDLPQPFKTVQRKGLHLHKLPKRAGAHCAE